VHGGRRAENGKRQKCDYSGAVFVTKWSAVAPDFAVLGNSQLKVWDPLAGGRREFVVVGTGSCTKLVVLVDRGGFVQGR
jgi:hypothetical protein